MNFFPQGVIASAGKPEAAQQGDPSRMPWLDVRDLRSFGFGCHGLKFIASNP
jgi:hypothetical protein